MKTRYSRRRNSLLGGRPWMGPMVIGCIVLIAVFTLVRLFLPGVLMTLAKPFWYSGNAISH